MTVEREAKLIPGDDFRRPSFDELLSGSVTEPQTVRALDATYYDTAELELARWGITLRHRRGEPGRPWTLKFPEQTTSSVVVRDELTFDGTAATVPAGARDLVQAFTRGAPLVPVARLQTIRAPLIVHDADGTALVEIADDSVSILDLHGADEIGHFRELEVEATTAGRRSRVALRSAVDALVEAGCHADRPVPKLVRALGDRARQPPSVVIEPVAPDATSVDLIRHLTAKSVTQILLSDAGVRVGDDIEAVHGYRVAARRLRSDLRTFAPVLAEQPAKALRAQLAGLGAAVGPVRDLDVLGAGMAARARMLADQDQPAVDELVARLAGQRAEAREALLRTLRSDSYARLLDDLVLFAAAPPIDSASVREAERPVGARGWRVVKRRWRQLAAAVEAGGDDPTDEQLHTIRIAAKRCRYAAEAVRPVAGKPAKRFATRLSAVQAVLGDHHDTLVAEAWLRDAAVEHFDARVAIGALILLEQQDRVRLRNAWPEAWRSVSSRKSRAWLS